MIVDPESVRNLSTRELAVAEARSRGLSVREIADVTLYSHEAVKEALASIREKVGTTDPEQLRDVVTAVFRSDYYLLKELNRLRHSSS